MARQSLTLHATCVALAGKGILIIGPSGSGKSALALQLIALGAVLVADDRTIVTREGSALIATCPASIEGLVEARGVGLLPVSHIAHVAVALVIDLAQVEVDRLPQRHVFTVLDIDLACLHKVDAPYFPAAIHAYMHGSLKSRCDDRP